MTVDVQQALDNVSSQLEALEADREQLDKRIAKVREAQTALALVLRMARQSEAADAKERARVAKE